MTEPTALREFERQIRAELTVMADTVSSDPAEAVSAAVRAGETRRRQRRHHQQLLAAAGAALLVAGTPVVVLHAGSSGAASVATSGATSQPTTTSAPTSSGGAATSSDTPNPTTAATGPAASISWDTIPVAGGGQGDPDPGGRLLAAGKTVAAALPADARVHSAQAVEPRWDSCDAMAGTWGWDDVSVFIEFHTDTTSAQLAAHASAALARLGWHQTQAGDPQRGIGPTWTQTVGTSTMTASLNFIQGSAGPAWELAAVGAPVGPRAHGC